MDVAELIIAGDLLLQNALEALCNYHEARDALSPPEEVECLRQQSEALLRSLEKLQMSALGGLDALDALKNPLR